ncbi:Argonaute complex, subunit Arb1 [Aspergillus crustosus]
MENATETKEELEAAPDPPLVEAPKKKKKRSQRPKSKKGRGKPTGFEEYYVDAPITVEEYESEQSLYHESRPIIHRIEDALLRFYKARRIETDRYEIFTGYLIFGGINVGPNMFAGTDNRDLKEMDKDEILQARGRTSVNKDFAHLTIDFNAVVTGFLTSRFPFYYNPYNEEMIKLATVTIRSFLSYLLYHDVCPEYKDNIDEARKTCDLVGKELWKNQQLMASGPGDFNIACSTLFGGFNHDLYVENNQWKNTKADRVQMTKDIAQKVVRFGLAAAGSDDLILSYLETVKNGASKVKKLEDIHGFEVSGLQFLTSSQREIYQTEAPDLNPVGILYGTTYLDPGESDYDLSPTEREEWAKRGRHTTELRFFLEENLLELCYLGMKIISPIWELSCGFHYFEDTVKVYSSIYSPLANELMIGWKKPRAFSVKSEEDGENENEENEGNHAGGNHVDQDAV